LSALHRAFVIGDDAEDTGRAGIRFFGFSKEGGMYYERVKGHLREQFDWWPQAESVVGFFNAWQLTKDENYFELALRSWKFIQNYIIDKKNGEWFWGVNKHLEPLRTDKVSGWKAPYHNGRMCMEMIRRIGHSND
jgi:cellobiose epimerase